MANNGTKKNECKRERKRQEIKIALKRIEREFILQYMWENFFFIIIISWIYGKKNLHNVCTHNQEKRFSVSVIGALVVFSAKFNNNKSVVWQIGLIR